MFVSPLQAHALLGMPATVTAGPKMRHKRNASSANINMPVAMGGLVTPPMAAQYGPYMHDLNGNGAYEATSRSTSAYSIVTDAAAPLLKKEAVVPIYPGTYPGPQPEIVQKGRGQPFNIRLPSDQLEMIIKAIQVPHQTQNIGETHQIQHFSNPDNSQHTGDAASTMPPPPLPLHATTAKQEPQPDLGPPSFGLTLPPFGETGTNIGPSTRREDSRFSDISMHPSCTSFPACTTEDAEGRIVHSISCTALNNDASAPATVVRGRKEGSSPTKSKSQKSISTFTQTPPAQAAPTHASTTHQAQATKEDKSPAKKRVRRSTRLLQHDSGYYADSSDVDAGGEDVGAAVE